MRDLACRDFLGADDAFHYAKTVVYAQGGFGMHRHVDFAEVCWIERGRGVHEINGQRMPLVPGLLMLIRRGDCHQIRGDGDHAVQIGNVAFPTRLWERLARRYPQAGFEMLSRGIEARCRLWLSAEALADLQRMGDGMLIDRDRSAMALDRFLLNVCHLLRHHVQPVGMQAPTWLNHALTHIGERTWFARGVSGLFELAGRSGEHVTRTLRKQLGCTPTDVVNRARLRWAAQQLAVTDRPILDIAADCGLENLSHFYKLFRTHFGATPRRYRLSHRDTV